MFQLSHILQPKDAIFHQTLQMSLQLLMCWEVAAQNILLFKVVLLNLIPQLKTPFHLCIPLFQSRNLSITLIQLLKDLRTFSAAFQR